MVEVLIHFCFQDHLGEISSTITTPTPGSPARVFSPHSPTNPPPAQSPQSPTASDGGGGWPSNHHLDPILQDHFNSLRQPIRDRRDPGRRDPVHDRRDPVHDRRDPDRSDHDQDDPVYRRDQGRRDRRDPVHDRRDPVHDRRDPVHDRHDPVHDRHDPVHDRHDPGRRDAVQGPRAAALHQLKRGTSDKWPGKLIRKPREWIAQPAQHTSGHCAN
jgi:hypothetical protein